jgi:hypothetical protein
MKRDDYLSLPQNCEAVLEHLMIKGFSGGKGKRAYICSPCRSDTPDGIVRNMKAARVYILYAYIHLACVPTAPHAYLPVLLNDNDYNERSFALLLGKQILENCEQMLVYGNRLSEGM